MDSGFKLFHVRMNAYSEFSRGEKTEDIKKHPLGGYCGSIYSDEAARIGAKIKTSGDSVRTGEIIPMDNDARSALMVSIATQLPSPVKAPSQLSRFQSDLAEKIKGGEFTVQLIKRCVYGWDAVLNMPEFDEYSLRFSISASCPKPSLSHGVVTDAKGNKVGESGSVCELWRRFTRLLDESITTVPNHEQRPLKNTAKEDQLDIFQALRGKGQWIKTKQ